MHEPQEKVSQSMNTQLFPIAQCLQGIQHHLEVTEGNVLKALQVALFKLNLNNAIKSYCQWLVLRYIQN